MMKPLFKYRVSVFNAVVKITTVFIAALFFLPFKVTAKSSSFTNISATSISNPALPAKPVTFKDIEVRGTVTDTSGVGLPGVQITVKGRNGYGTVTDVNGGYLIRVPEDATLVYNLMGFLRQEVPVRSRDFIAVRLRQNTALLEDVVVVGYGTQQKNNVTGALTSVTSKELLRTPTASLTNSLAGRLPGLLTIQSSGEPGADGSALYIRGFGTYQGKSPLILVDGIENNIDGIDANDVESVSVLKDAAATAVYGMKGANGVVLVTTKRGKTGKPVISLTAQVAAQQPINMPKYLDSYNALTLFREALNNDGLNANLYTDEYLNKFRDRSNPTYEYLYPNVNWSDELIKPYSLMNQTNLNVSGGSSTARYFVSMAYLRQAGLYKYDNLNAYNINAVLNKYNFRSNIDIDLTSLLKLELNLSNIVRDRNYPTETASAFWGEIRNTPSYLYPLKNPNGSVAAQKDAPPNPYGRLTQYGYTRMFENTLNSIVGFTLKLPFITEGLSFRTRFAYDALNYRNINRKRNYSTYKFTINESETDLSKGNYEELSTGDGLLGFAIVANGSRKSTYEAYLNYDRTFAKKHAVSGMIRYNQAQSFLATSNDDGAIAALPYKQLGLVGRLNYAYDRRYVLEFDAGYNGSENFRKGKRMGFFPAGSAGWIVSNEEFLKNSKVVSLMKLRGSYGIVGVDNSAGRFAYLSTWQTGNGSGYRFGLAADGNSFSGAQESATGNEFLTWEQSAKANVGIDLELLNGEIAFTGDVFREKRTQILTVARVIPDVTGVQNLPAINAGIVNNKGFEGELTWRKRFKDHYLMLRGSYSYATNRIVYAAEPVYALAYRGLKGTQINEAYGLIANGLFKDQADIAASPVQQFGPVRPGDIKYVDRNGDGVVNTQDQGYLEQVTTPKSIMGLTVSYTYNRFDVNVLFQGTTGGKTWLTGTSAWAFASNSSVLADYVDGRWTSENPNPNAEFPRLSSSNNVNNNQNSTFWLKSSDYLRIKNIEIGYTLSKTWVKKIGLSNVRTFISGSNIYTWSKMKIFDPEIPNGFGNYPQLRVVNLGLNVSM
ncbi:SusC/RagA family TonB-linked outer membrane protein [Mucilaginibacter aquatilis]|uniref:SusC/RagA family TonB-linked outer membrane protein n=1 Tax=Mucilaginibacter aquatilis TaxID=1517760 RepID=A0A6I4I7Q1_9SPHI|nr:TonB-dependent receptor [Mucilaginibacter aquatilis]MVN91245.1 SusC/RagA family TonB-linked outer membrane protein [Mucilaginibacter aquatilis]